MPRLPRLFAQEFPSHITLRGNNRQEIFRCDGDRLRFISCLRDAAGRNGLAVHAYVLMTNHVHLLATGQHSASTPRTIQSVGRRYVAYFNGRYGRTGTLWEGRYRSTLIDADGYLLACHRYIDLNPVRAGLVRLPQDARIFDHPLEGDVLDRIRACSNKGWVLGSPDFCRLVEERLRRRALPLPTGRKKARTRGVA